MGRQQRRCPGGSATVASFWARRFLLRDLKEVAGDARHSIFRRPKNNAMSISTWISEWNPDDEKFRQDFVFGRVFAERCAAVSDRPRGDRDSALAADAAAACAPPHVLPARSI
ncbi:MAG TPA: hypothetical protein VE396_02350 [Xanthobacteraceae bacterium]|jgi:hypothetical protein|nr:hypothetical protein [Xanthobacteraceae bacterium]